MKTQTYQKPGQEFILWEPLRLLKRRLVLSAAVALAFGATFMGCGGERGLNPDPVPLPGPKDPSFLYSRATSVFVSGADVYVAGEVTWHIYGSFTEAVLWKNGVAQYFTNRLQSSSEVASVFVSSGDTYVAGKLRYNGAYGSGPFAAVWRNGTPTRPISAETVTSVFVFGSDVYVAGVAYGTGPTGQIFRIPMLWKNYITQMPIGGRSEGEASSVFVSDGDVYVAGYEKSDDGQNNIAVLWKNGSPQYLSDGTRNANASSVFVFDNDVYVTVNDGSATALWKNGTPQQLTAGGNNAIGLMSMFVSGDDVYVLGITEHNNGKVSNCIIWKNGSPHQYITNESSNNQFYVSSIFVSGDDVYAVGQMPNEGTNFGAATLWKNGVPQRLNH